METASKQPRGRGKGRQFKPGQSGNPNGRPPKEWTWRGLLMEAAEASTEDGLTVKHHAAAKLVAKAASGDIAALKEFGDRIDGKPMQSHELTGKGGGPIEAGMTVAFK